VDEMLRVEAEEMAISAAIGPHYPGSWRK